MWRVSASLRGTLVCRPYSATAASDASARDLKRHVSAATYELKPQYVKQALVPLAGATAPGATVDLRESVFARSPVRVDLIQRVVVWQLAKRRQGTAKGKNRAEVSGTGRKGGPQKGSGKARVGSRRAIQFRGGGRAFPKRPRSFDFPLPQRVRQLGLINALSAKFGQGKLFVVPSLRLEEGKTKELATLMKDKQWDSALFVGGDTVDATFERAAFNLASVDVLPARGLNVYDIMRRTQLVMTVDAVEYVHKLLTRAD